MNYKIKSYELNNNLINNTTILLFKIVYLLIQIEYNIFGQNILFYIYKEKIFTMIKRKFKTKYL